MPRRKVEKPKPPCLWCGKPIEQEPGQSNISYVASGTHLGECRHLYDLEYTRMWGRKKRREKMSKRVAGADLTDYITTVELAKAAGVNSRTIGTTICRSGKDHWPNYFVRLGAAYVHYTLAEEILKRNAPIPKGWKSFKWLRLELGAYPVAWLKQLEREGKITVLVHAKGKFVSGEDAEFIVRTYRDALPMKGWVKTTDVARQVGVNRNAVKSWVDDHPEVETRKWRNGSHFAVYIKEVDAARYINLRSVQTRRRQRVLLEAA